MIDGAEQVEVRDVEVVAATYFTLRCIIGGRFVGVPCLKTLPGTDVARRGDRGRLVLQRDVAERLGLGLPDFATAPSSGSREETEGRAAVAGPRIELEKVLVRESRRFAVRPPAGA